MSNKLFLPFLTDDIGRSLDVEDSVVVKSSLPNPLENAPEGWESNTIQFSRNTEFRGVIRAYITNLKFYLEGATILRNAFYRMGMEAVLFFIWLRQNRTFGAGMKYESWYKGEVDLGTFKDEYDGVEVNVTEGGFSKDLQANKGIIQTLDFDEDAKYLFLDGMNLNETLNYEIQDGFTTGPDYNYLYMPLTFLNNEGSSSGLVYYSQLGENQLSPDYNSTRYFLGTQKLLGAHFTGSIKFKITDLGTGGFIRAKFYLHTQTRLFMISDDQDYTPGEYSIPFDFNWDILSGENVYFMSDAPSSSISAIITFHQSDFKVKYTTRSDASLTPSYRAYDLGNKIVGKISQGAVLSSPILEADFHLLCASGDAVRRLQGAQIKTNFSDWYKSVDAVKCLSLKITDNNPVVTSRYDDFNTSTIADLGECNKWALEPADEYIYDSVEAGYTSKGAQSTDDVNGKYSFNNTFNWKINATRRKTNLYSAKSVYYADPYDIELIRLNFNQKDTTTANTDNSIFFLDCEPKTDISYSGVTHFYDADNRIELTGDITAIQPFLVPGVKLQISGGIYNNYVFTITQIIDITEGTDAIFAVKELIPVGEDAVTTVSPTNLYKLRRLPYSSITGIPNDGTVFNLELSPRRILQNHLRWLRSSFVHLDVNSLVFQSTEKNADLVTTDGSGNVISEKADIPVSGMGAKVFLPYYTTSEFESPENLLNLMTANSSGKFNYSMKGIPIEGFPIDIKSEDTYGTSQEFKLLLTANNDLTKIILNR